MKVIKKVIKSFCYAIEGLIYSVKSERNIKIHLIAAILVLILSKAMKLNKYEFLFVIVAIGMVIISELFNTSIEKSIDASFDEYNPLIKIAKDVAAGAVLFAAVIALIIGITVFYDKIFMFIIRR